MLTVEHVAAQLRTAVDELSELSDAQLGDLSEHIEHYFGGSCDEELRALINNVRKEKAEWAARHEKPKGA